MTFMTTKRNFKPYLIDLFDKIRTALDKPSTYWVCDIQITIGGQQSHWVAQLNHNSRKTNTFYTEYRSDTTDPIMGFENDFLAVMERFEAFPEISALVVPSKKFSLLRKTQNEFDGLYFCECNFRYRPGKGKNAKTQKMHFFGYPSEGERFLHLLSLTYPELIADVGATVNSDMYWEWK